jgi:hypothetical protein
LLMRVFTVASEITGSAAISGRPTAARVTPIRARVGLLHVDERLAVRRPVR